MICSVYTLYKVLLSGSNIFFYHHCVLFIMSCFQLPKNMIQHWLLVLLMWSPLYLELLSHPFHLPHSYHSSSFRAGIMFSRKSPKFSRKQVKFSFCVFLSNHLAYLILVIYILWVLRTEIITILPIDVSPAQSNFVI